MYSITRDIHCICFTFRLYFALKMPVCQDLFSDCIKRLKLQIYLSGRLAAFDACYGPYVENNHCIN